MRQNGYAKCISVTNALVVELDASCKNSTKTFRKRLKSNETKLLNMNLATSGGNSISFLIHETVILLIEHISLNIIRHSLLSLHLLCATIMIQYPSTALSMHDASEY